MRVLAATLAALATALSTSAATPSNTPADYAQATLRDGCAQSYASHVAYAPPGGPMPAFTGERSKGDNRYYNNAKPCDEAQYAVYLEKADRATVAMAYPPSPGKLKVKKTDPGAVATAKAK